MATEGLDFNPLHTLGFLVTDWVEAHCRVPGGVYEGEPLTFNGWQLFCTVNHYRVVPGAVADPRRLVVPFHYRRSVVVGPQKCGKSPWGAGMLLAEGVGPTLFAGWASVGDVYRCSDHGCGCGWEYAYQAGEAMGVPRRKSLLGLLAIAETQTANVYEPLQTMIHSGPLGEFVKVREGFIRLPNRGMIVPMSSAAKSKLGKPLTGALGDESGLYTAQNRVLDAWQTIRRGVAGMQGRTIELTNPWDPMENSAAQQAFESRQADIFRYYRKPPAGLSYANKRERHRIHKYVYADSPWVDVAGIDGEAAELVETDPTQAERFFGNRLVQGLGAWLLEDEWVSRADPGRVVPDGASVALGFDGSDNDDWTAIRLCTRDGFTFTPSYGPDSRPTIWNPAEWGGQIPRGEVHAAVDEIERRFRVVRANCDPRDWQSEIGDWSQRYGEKYVEWSTFRTVQMHEALVRARTDLLTGRRSHDGCQVTQRHALAARKVAKPGDRYLLGKPSGNQKIDAVMADTLAYEAAAEATEGGLWAAVDEYVYF